MAEHITKAERVKGLCYLIALFVAPVVVALFQ
jgi:hypothetical protein